MGGVPFRSVQEVGGVSVFRRLRSGCEVDAVCTNPPSDTVSGNRNLPIHLPPHVLNNISGRDSAEEPTSSPSLQDEKIVKAYSLLNMQ